MRGSCLSSMLVVKHVMICSALRYILLIHEAANLHITSIGFFFYRFLWSGREIITIIAHAAHFLCMIWILVAYYAVRQLPWFSPSSYIFPLSHLVIEFDVLTHLLNALFFFLSIPFCFLCYFPLFCRRSLLFSSLFSEINTSAHKSSEGHPSLFDDTVKTFQVRPSNLGHYMPLETYVKVDWIVNRNIYLCNIDVENYRAMPGSISNHNYDYAHCMMDVHLFLTVNSKSATYATAEKNVDAVKLLQNG